MRSQQGIISVTQEPRSSINTPSRDRSSRQRACTLVATMLGMLMGAVDQTVVATAGPTLQHDLSLSAAAYGWMIASYLLVCTVLGPIVGRLLDAFGKRSVILLGLVIFVIASLACGLSSTAGTLIAARAAQGAGAASLFIGAFSVVGELFSGVKRNRYMSIYAAIWGLGSIVGPFLGGLLTDRLGWHWVFFVNVPIGCFAIVLLLIGTTQMRPPSSDRRIDVLGALAFLATTVPLLTALSLNENSDRSVHAASALATASGRTGLLAISAVAFSAFLAIERNARLPLLDLTLFRSRTFSLANAAMFTLGLVFLPATVFVPLFLVNVTAASATTAGVALVPLSVGIVIGNAIVGKIGASASRFRWVLLTSLAVLVGAYALLAFALSVHSQGVMVEAMMVLVGLGLGPAIPLYTAAVQNAVAPNQLGVATASVTFFRQLGASVGITVLTATFAHRLASASQHGAVPAEALTEAIRAVFTLSLGLAGLTLLLSALIPTPPVAGRKSQ